MILQAENRLATRLKELPSVRNINEAARSLLELRFSKAERARMNHLARKNQEGLLSDQERQELESYVKVGDVLSLLHLKARKWLKG